MDSVAVPGGKRLEMERKTAKHGPVRGSFLSLPHSSLGLPTPWNTGCFIGRGRERDPYRVCCCLNLPTKAELGHIFRALGRENGCAEFPDCSNSPASDNKSFVMWAHSVESIIRPAQRHSIYPPFTLNPTPKIHPVPFSYWLSSVGS